MQTQSGLIKNLIGFRKDRRTGGLSFSGVGKTRALIAIARPVAVLDTMRAGVMVSAIREI
jgi:hypothetical protein